MGPRGLFGIPGIYLGPPELLWTLIWDPLDLIGPPELIWDPRDLFGSPETIEFLAPHNFFWGLAKMHLLSN